MQGTKILKVPTLWDVTLCQVPKYCLTLKQKVLRFFECRQLLCEPVDISLRAKFVTFMFQLCSVFSSDCKQVNVTRFTSRRLYIPVAGSAAVTAGTKGRSATFRAAKWLGCG